jgi:uncharacterized protein (DUF952 family)/GNAT superfamily N-acetyltransferase
MAPAVILHITTVTAWEAARRAGEYRGDTLATQGFIHCSTGRQWLRPLRAHFGEVGDPILLQVDEARLGDVAVRYEEAEPEGDRFPHVYGPLPAAAVVAGEPVPSGVVTDWEPLPEGLAALVVRSRGAEPADWYEWRHRGHIVTTRPGVGDLEAVHGWLAEHAYWAQGRSWERMVAVSEASICFWLLDPRGATAGFCRVATDGAVFAYLGDVLVLPAYRGRGLGAFLVRSALEHPELQGVRRWLLGTRDAHGLYARFGFRAPAHPEWWMFRPG